MKILRGFTYLSTLLAVVAFLRPSVLAARMLLWPFKLLGGALSTILGLISGLGAISGLLRRDWRMAGIGAVGVGLVARFLRDVPGSQKEFADAFGAEWEDHIPASLRPRLLPRRWSLRAASPGEVAWQRDVVYAENPKTGATLRADVWEPPPGVPPTGLAAIYVHGGAWRLGDKDMGTRPFFRRLAGQGHVILDIAYTLWPQGDIPTMVSEVKQAILWMKENGKVYGVEPERIVLMGGSAGGHLALLTAYTPGHPALPSLSGEGDASVRGVVAFYPPVNFLSLQEHREENILISEWQKSLTLLDRVAEDWFAKLFKLHDEDIESELDARNLISAILGGQPDEMPQIYRLLSPISHVGPDCPPTLLLQGSDDIFDLAPEVRRLDQDLRRAGVSSVLIEFPNTEHAFDLVFPRLSPVAQAATYDVERFLALLI